MTTPAPSILDTIDNAIADHELSADAMRWTPDPQPAGGGHVPALPDIARLFELPPGFLTTGGRVTATPDVAAFAESCGMVLTEWQRQVANNLYHEQITVRFDATARQMRRIVAEAMKGLGDALRPLLDEIRTAEQGRPERVSRLRRAYRAKRRGW